LRSRMLQLVSSRPMNKVSWIVLVLLAVPAVGQPQGGYSADCTSAVTSLSLLLTRGHEQVEASLEDFTDNLKRKQNRYQSRIEFARYVFVKTHGKFLDHYSRYTEFEKIFEARQYNCLTGTALYAYLYSHLGFKVTIFETRYHSLIKIECPDGIALIESTDFSGGFVAGSAKADSALQDYLKREGSIKVDSLALPVNKYASIRAIDFRQLAGLHYFNIGVVAFNKGRYSDAISPLQLAASLYPESERIFDLIVLTEALLGQDQNSFKHLSSQQISDDQTTSYP
jgi:tetratricopeptide (TPR) repeat protein